ncbi:GDSL-type esterase/lipase family protein [Nocardiopsis sp. MG754419]|uniref:GDSL-type esterase/lipase family protein n=1 Tax=Nocardiopsis sp. MG754419 TaxID=2259865 RepID=UPI001BA8EC23|nr:GDSL-type esterase/lipase family protein [Nocardiopsis sp. MG754419]MBR8743823.1 lipase [Nocardiopsis sp. MG754419]
MNAHPTTAPLTPDLIQGALEVERTERGLAPHRLPSLARSRNTDPQLAMAESQPSGVRLALRTRATVIELDTVPTKRRYVGTPPRPDGVYDLRVDGRLTAQGTVAGGDVLEIDMTTGTFATTPGDAGTLRFDGLPDRLKDVEIWLPHNETTELVALRTDAPVAPVGASGRRVWLHHGSSISHGSDAASPTTIWPVIAADRGGVDLINLGLGGSALLDPFTARAMRDTPADLISVKLGINLANADLMRLRALGPAVHGFLDTLRDGHPEVPLVVVSAIYCPVHEHTPGPGALDPEALREGRVGFTATGDPSDPTRLTLTTIRRELERVVRERSAQDTNLHYLDGRELYGEDDFAELPLPDGLHPDAATHHRIGDRFADRVFDSDGPFV